MCLFPSFGAFLDTHSDCLHYVSASISILNLALLSYFLIELYILRKIKCCHLSHAYLAVLLSMLAALLSSIFFTLSSSGNTALLCGFTPIIALSFRTLCKSFTWALYIVRGQMVIESLENDLLSNLTQYAPYILGLQCVAITSLIIMFTETGIDESAHYHPHCTTFVPLWLIMCSAVVGEIFYGLGFLYLFYHAMSTSLNNVYKAVTRRVADNTREQIRHHIKVYMIQLITSIVFLLFVSSCICFQTLLFFDAELLISNLCLLMLFRHKFKLCKKALVSSKYCCCDDNELIIAETLPAKMPAIRARIYSERAVTFDPNKAAVNTPNTNYFFSNKWRSSREVIDMKHALKAHTIPQSGKDNDKVLEIMGVKPHINDTDTSDITTRPTAQSVSSYIERRHTDILLSTSSLASESQLKHIKFLSMSDVDIPRPLKTIPGHKTTDDIRHMPMINTILSAHPQYSKSTTDIKSVRTNAKESGVTSQSVCLLSAQDIKPKVSISSTTFIGRVSSFVNKFKHVTSSVSLKADFGNASPVNVGSSTGSKDIFAAFEDDDMVRSLSDPIHQSDADINVKRMVSISEPMDKL